MSSTFSGPLLRLAGALRVGWSGVIVVASCLSGVSAQEEEPMFFIREYRVTGSTKLAPLDIESAVYPYLGPARTAGDVEQARNALEAAFREKGFQTVSVLIPQQDPRFGVIRLAVVEGRVGRLNVTGAKWFLPSRIRAEVPSLAEGGVPDFNKVGKEIVALNRLADRRVTPSLTPGAEEGTVDIDLQVEDKLPLHGSLEINNRYSPNTSPLRINGVLSYGNLFQRGHTLGVSFQVAPENTDDALVYSGYYMARVSDGVSLMLQGTKQDSEISTLGGGAVVGRGEIVGLRAMFDLPSASEGKFYQSLSLGLDYKSFGEDILIGESTVSAPIEYFPLSASYAATMFHESGFTEANASLTLGLRGLGSDAAAFNTKRFGASGNFAILRADAAHTRDLKSGAQLFGKIQGQLSDQQLINTEQLSGGGLGTVRGYLEGTALGDHGAFATAEYRTRSFIGSGDPKNPLDDEWRFHVFAEGGALGLRNALPGQSSSSAFASFGVGSRIRYGKFYNGSVDVAVPLHDVDSTHAGDVRVTFRGWASF